MFYNLVWKINCGVRHVALSNSHSVSLKYCAYLIKYLYRVDIAHKLVSDLM